MSPKTMSMLKYAIGGFVAYKMLSATNRNVKKISEGQEHIKDAAEFAPINSIWREDATVGIFGWGAVNWKVITWDGAGSVMIQRVNGSEMRTIPLTELTGRYTRQ